MPGFPRHIFRRSCREHIQFRSAGILGDGQQAGHIGKLHVGEHNFMNDRIYEAYFGVTEDEVRDLFREYKSVSFEELKQWYDGYRMSDGRRLFNPRSVLTHIFAIAQNNEGKEWIQKNLRFSRKP
ncbi:AAA family ATPase [Hominibacterium faecale]|uniref:AAA family ATPase n=2 Tax=Peptostreptococcales TaxID=3082720 RepID=UPI00345C14C7